ncbi:MAG: Cof-type HAD-IIB family hydrolase [Oscillospiraceae bacterium]|nr:Cof-type HAD-IIB family hydrolase [Oscillospiraceae bacterium]
MPVRMIMADLDGTLLHEDKQLSRRNYEALEKAAGRGIEIVIATGRFFGGIPAQLRSAPFFRYAVTGNGSKVLDSKTDTIIYRAEMSARCGARVLDCLERYPVSIDCYVGDLGYMARSQYDHLDRYISQPVIQNMVRNMRVPVDHFREFVLSRGCGLQKLQSFCLDHAIIDQIRQTLTEQFGEQLVLTGALKDNIEINDCRATKAHALRALCDHIGMDCCDVMTFGDADNDLAMTRAAGFGVAMANARPAVRSAADYITSANDDDGVAAAIEKLILS